MISVGSGNCVLFDANQLQADKQTNAASKRTLNRTPAVRYDEVTVSRSGLHVKFHLTVGEILRLLRVRGASKLCPGRSINQRRIHMTTAILTVRAAQALVAVIATAASVLIFQFAMLAG
jgi:hypothetical protein